MFLEINIFKFLSKCFSIFRSHECLSCINIRYIGHEIMPIIKRILFKLFAGFDKRTFEKGRFDYFPNNVTLNQENSYTNLVNALFYPFRNAPAF